MGEAGAESTLRGEAGARTDLPGTICCVVCHLQRIAFLLGATVAGAGPGAGERGAAVAYFSLSRTALFHWQAFLPVLLEPDGVLSALRLVHGLLEAAAGITTPDRLRGFVAAARIAPDVVADIYADGGTGRMRSRRIKKDRHLEKCNAWRTHEGLSDIADALILKDSTLTKEIINLEET